MNEKINLLEQSGEFKEALKEIEKELSRLREEYNNAPSIELEIKIKAADINRIACNLKIDENKDNQLFLRGKLIQKLKEYLKYTKGEETNYIKYLIEQELIKHKNLCKEIRTNKEDKITIDKSLGLKIQEISDAIRIFLSKHDVLNKIKNVGNSVVTGGAISIAIQSILSIISGQALTIPMLISELPVCAYIGISSIIRNMVTKTSYQEYAYKHSDKYIELINKSKEEFKPYFESVASLIQEKQDKKNISEIVEINNQIIAKYDQARNNSKVEELSDALKLEKHNLLLENKKIMEDEIEKYVNNKKTISVTEYQTLNKYYLQNNINLFESENAIKEGAKEGIKNLGMNAAILLAARVIASAIVPGYKINDINSLLYALGIVSINDLIGIINYNGKLTNTKYNGQKIMFNNQEKSNNQVSNGPTLSLNQA